MSQNTPKGMRLHIGIFGRRNVGKSSLLNALTRQNVSIVSDTAGTTTDPVEKAMELLPFGPVLFIDTAGIDDEGALGTMRIEKTHKALERTDLGVVVTDFSLGNFEKDIIEKLGEMDIPVVVVYNKSDLGEEYHVADEPYLSEKKLPYIVLSAMRSQGIVEFKELLLGSVPADFINNPDIVGDIVGAGNTCVLVVPIDKEAPKGRLILPQVQTIRDLLDSDAVTVVVKERELSRALEGLKTPPALVVTDSQAFLKVDADTPRDIPMTSFSILYSRFKGDLIEQTRGAMAVEKLQPGDRVLIAEACSHHPIADDIGRVKIPRWLTQYVGGRLNIDSVQGHDFPDDLSPYKLVIHCGACMWNRREMLSRLMECKRQGVPITNYGLVIAYSLGIFKRALGPFPAALEVFLEGEGQ